MNIQVMFTFATYVHVEFARRVMMDSSKREWSHETIRANLLYLYIIYV